MNSPKTKAAASIVEQMLNCLTNEKHGHLWIAKNTESKKICAVLIGNDNKNGLVIRFILSNVFELEAKGSGKFLIHEMVKLAKKNTLAIRTTSENADAFWKKCPGFQLDKLNPPDYICTPQKPSTQKFFKESVDMPHSKKKINNKKCGFNNEVQKRN